MCFVNKVIGKYLQANVSTLKTNFTIDTTFKQINEYLKNKNNNIFLHNL